MQPHQMPDARRHLFFCRSQLDAPVPEAHGDRAHQMNSGTVT